MKLYLKLFLATGIPFGLIMGVMYGDLTKGLFVGLFFGFFMSLILGTLNIIFTKKSTSQDSSKATGVHQTKVLELQLPYDKTFDLCISSLDSVKGTVKQEERSLGKVVAKTGMTWKSFGETIQFDVRKIDNEKTQVQISSKPALPTTLVDYGRNLENVEKITEFFNKSK